MKELKFDIYAMARPKTPEDILALLRDFRAEAAELLSTLNAVGDACRASLRDSTTTA